MLVEGFAYSALGLIPVLPPPFDVASDRGVKPLLLDPISDLVVVYFLSTVAADKASLLATVVPVPAQFPVPGVVLPTDDLPPLDRGMLLPPAPLPLG